MFKLITNGPITVISGSSPNYQVSGQLIVTGGFNPSDIQVGYRIFNALGNLYQITNVVSTDDFASTFTVDITEITNAITTPTGTPSTTSQSLVYDPGTSEGIPEVFFNVGSSANADILAAIASYNAQINKLLTSKSDTRFLIENHSYSWWCDPISVYHTETNRNYFTTIGPEGANYIHYYDNETKETFSRLILDMPIAKDEHNTAAFVIRDTEIIVAFTGHNDIDVFYVAKFDFDLNQTQAPTDIISQLNVVTTTYTQLWVHNNRIYLATRTLGSRWSLSYSDDEGVTWTLGRTLFNKENNPALAAPYLLHVLDGDKVHFIAYYNPTGGDSNYMTLMEMDMISGDLTSGGDYIRNMFISEPPLDLDNTLFTRLYDPPSTFAFRMLDASRIGNDIYVAFAEFETNQDLGNYYIIKFNSIDYTISDKESIVAHGKRTYNTYVGGVYFHKNSSGEWNGLINVARESEKDGASKWYNEIYSRSTNGKYSLNSQFDVQETGADYNSIMRFVPPLNITDGGFIGIYQKGTYAVGDGSPGSGNGSFFEWNNNLRCVIRDGYSQMNILLDAKNMQFTGNNASSTVMNIFEENNNTATYDGSAIELVGTPSPSLVGDISFKNKTTGDRVAGFRGIDSNGDASLSIALRRASDQLYSTLFKFNNAGELSLNIANAQAALDIFNNDPSERNFIRFSNFLANQEFSGGLELCEIYDEPFDGTSQSAFRIYYDGAANKLRFKSAQTGTIREPLTIERGGNIGIGTDTPSTLLDVNGVINVNDNKITGVALPTNNSDVANKEYVDSIESISFEQENIATVDFNTYIDKGVFSEVIQGDQANSPGGTNADYYTLLQFGRETRTVRLALKHDNTEGAIYIQNGITGNAGTFTPWVKLQHEGDAGGVVLSNLLNPVNPQDAATKSYVDSQITSSGGSRGTNTVTTNGSGEASFIISPLVTVPDTITLTLKDGGEMRTVHVISTSGNQVNLKVYNSSGALANTAVDVNWIL